MKKFRKKPVVVEAVQLTKEYIEEKLKSRNYLEFFKTLDGKILAVYYKPTYVIVETLEGDMRAEIGDWLIRGVNGEIYTCKSDIFQKTYEPVEEVIMKPFVWKSGKSNSLSAIMDMYNKWKNGIYRYNRDDDAAELLEKIPELVEEIHYLRETKDGAYWERNMLALFLANYMNSVYAQNYRITNPTGEIKNWPCGWYRHEGEGFEDWSKVISIANGKFTFHVPNDFDLGELPEIKPNWDGHTTEEKWKNIMKICGCRIKEG